MILVTNTRWHQEKRSNGLIEIVNQDERTIASVNFWPGEEAQEQCHGRLIAAAPELLAACREMVANMEDGESTLDCDGNEFSDYAAAKAAIAKAEGNEH